MDSSAHSARERIAQACDQAAFWSLVAIAIGLPLAFNPSGNAYFDLPKMVVLRGAVMVGAAAWAAKSVALGRLEWVRTALDWPLLALFASGCATTALALNRHISFYGGLNTFDGLLNLACYIVIFYLAVNFVSSRQRLTWLTAAALSAAALMSANAISERLAPAVLPFPLAGGGIDPSRSSATFGNPIYAGAYITLALPITLATLLYWIRLKGHRVGDTPAKTAAAAWSLAGLLAIEIAALLFTQARAAWIGAAAGIVVVAAMLAGARRVATTRGASSEVAGSAHRKPARVVTYVLTAAAIVAGVGLLYGLSTQQTGVPRGQSLSQRAGELAQVSSGSGFNRIYLWKMTVPMILAQPPSKPTPSLDARLGPLDVPASLVRPLLGYGFDSYLELFPRFRPADWYRAIREDAVPAQPHNDLLQVAVAQGLIGLTAYLAVLGAFMFTGVRGGLRARQRMAQYTIAGLLGATGAYLIQLQAGFAVIGVAGLFWMAAGLAISLSQGDQREARRVSVALPTHPQAIQVTCYALLGALVLWGSAGLYQTVAADRALRAAQDAFNRGTFGESLTLLDQAVAANPAESRFAAVAARMAGDAYVRTKDGSYADAGLAFARRASRLDPFLTEPYFTEASINRDLASRTGPGAQQLAAAQYRQILSIDPHNEDALFNLALTEYDLQSYTQAVSLLRQAVALRPDDGDAYEALGAALVRAGKPNEGLLALERAVELKPNSTYARQQLETLKQKMSGKAR